MASRGRRNLGGYTKRGYTNPPTPFGGHQACLFVCLLTLLADAASSPVFRQEKREDACPRNAPEVLGEDEVAQGLWSPVGKDTRVPASGVPCRLETIARAKARIGLSARS